MDVRKLFSGLVLIGLFSMAVRETVDPDMWWHLRTGEFILEEGIPRTDIFSYTVPENQWIAHEWLSEVVMWLVHLAGGLPLLILFFAAVITAAYWLLYLRSDGKPYLAGFVVIMAALASAPLWGARPQMFNLLFAAFFVFIVEGYKDRKLGKRALWLLPLGTLIWANLHSGYLFGIALLIAYVIGETLEQLIGSPTNRSLSWSGIRWLFLMAVICFIVAVLNPNGPELWIYPFFTLGSAAMQRYIQEWQSPDFHNAIFWPFVALVSLGVISWLASRRKPTWTDLLLFGATALAGLMSVRHIPLFTVVAVPIVSRYLMMALDGSRLYPLFSGQSVVYTTNRRQVLNWVLVILAIVVAAIWTFQKIDKNDEVISAVYPVDAVDFLEESGLSNERGFNSYGWGGYLIWRGIPVFVDGRADVYGDEFLFHYLNAFDVTDKWREPLDDYDVSYVLIDPADHLGLLLTEADGWDEVYEDDVAQIFVAVGGLK
jgi:hypothetical protein